MLLRFIFCFYILFSLDEFFLILFITPVYNFIINRLADESAVLRPLSLHNNRYWSDLPAFQYPCSFVPYTCKVTRRFSAHSSLFQYSTGTSTKTAEYISSCHSSIQVCKAQYLQSSVHSDNWNHYVRHSQRVLKHSQTEFRPLLPWYHPHKEISAVLPVNPVSFSKQL